ncbi:HAD-IA family hydrolase [Mucilaginibacter gynuensis]|uniref:HAD-IA family hydrolase n=1 Tax=Mucilaginibacter gynuensis TaxID=1302236 RepID=A0ABP8H214_9SPHI
MNANTDQKFRALSKLADGDFEAFLYDCDGTLADNMPAHKAAFIKLAAQSGVDLDGAAIVDELAGWPVVNVVEEINKRFNSTFDPVTFAEQRYKIFFDEFIDDTLPIDFVVEHLKANAGKIRIGIVSGGHRHAVEKTLRILGIYELADVLVCAGETPHGKPHADPFLAAATALGVDPAKCMVFEDGDAGVKAAEAAGMQWIRIDKI